MKLPHNHHNQSSAILESVPASENFRTVAAFFKQLGDPNRIRILWLLCHTEECVINIAAMMGMSSPATVHHLKLLKEAGLIESRKEGKEVYYKASDTEEAAALHFMIEEMMKISCPDTELEHRSHGHVHDTCNSCDAEHCIPNLPHVRHSQEAEDTQINAAVLDTHELIGSIHDYITQDLGKHYSIEELSKIFHINTTSLKKQFKDAYGQPIASYMKDYRMKAAAQYLAQTSLEVGEIAESVGYSNHGKFSAAFKEYSGMLPRQYRSVNQK